MPPRTTRARRIPAKNKLTPEAEARLADQGIRPQGDESGSAVYAPSAESENLYTGPVIGEPSIQSESQGPEYQKPPTPEPRTENVGSLIDEAIESGKDDKPLVDPERLAKGDTPKTGAPKADEWLDFFSRIVLKVGIELYTDFAFRGVDETRVTPEDLKRIQIRKDERDVIARPFAEYASKSDLGKKHGRKIVALTDSAESLVTLGILARRINRIAKKYKPVERKPMKPQNVRIHDHGDNGQTAGDGINGTTGGKLPFGEYGINNPGSG